MIFYRHISLPEGTCGFLLESTFQAPSRRASPCSSKRGRDSTTFAGTSAKLGDHSKEKTLFFAGLWAYVHIYIIIYIYIKRFGASDQQCVKGAPRLLYCFGTLVGLVPLRPTGIAADLCAAASIARALTILCRLSSPVLWSPSSIILLGGLAAI